MATEDNNEDNGLEYSLKINENSEHDSLFNHGTWSIDEVDKDGKVVNENLIPWDWGVDTQATSIIYHASHDYDVRYDDDDKEIDTHTDTESLSGSLDLWGDEYNWRHPRLEMFGTSRVIKDLSLVIYRSGEGDDKYEGLTAYGGLEFESEIDFRRETVPDFLQFTLYLHNEKFDELKKLVIENRVTNVSLRVLKCQGFYSYWSPSISTHQIKILTSDHKTKLPEGKEDIPRLGEVDRYQFSYSVNNDLVVASETDDEEEIEELFEDEPVRTREQYIQEKTNTELQSINSTLNKTRYFAIAIVVLLFFILISS